MLCIISCLFLQELLLYAVRKTFQARWRCQDPPLNISSWTSCDSFFFQDFFWLSHFTYHISASLPWYQICWITGLGYCIIYFAFEVLVWRPGLPSCIGTVYFLSHSSWSLPLECLSSPLTLLLISMTCSNRFVPKAKSIYLPFFFNC